jgi:hypothetical protein
MGLEYCCCLFIGRQCTPEEIERFWNGICNTNIDEEKREYIFSVPDACSQNMFQSDDDLPMVAHTYNHNYMSLSELLECDKEEFLFFVVQHVVFYTSDRYTKRDLIPVSLNSIPKAKDERYGLLHAHYTA